jgi:hypothetical protein
VRAQQTSGSKHTHTENQKLKKNKSRERDSTHRLGALLTPLPIFSSTALKRAHKALNETKNKVSTKMNIILFFFLLIILLELFFFFFFTVE